MSQIIDTLRMLEYGLDDRMELVLDHILTGVGNVVDWRETKLKIQIDGLPLDELFAPVDAPSIKESVPPEEEILQREEIATLGLQGKRVVISSGHGWYYLESDRTYHLQRPYEYGIVEDFVNAEMVMYLNSELTQTGADVRPARNVAKNAGIGETGHAKWEEAAKYHIKALGAPSSVYNSASSDLDSDIRSRPLYANYVAGDILVSVHNNAALGTGSETWYDDTNASNAESRRLATTLHNKVVTRIRQDYDRNWVDRGLKSCNGCKGENRLATRPAVILEVAFMDRQAPDNQYLHDERFKQLVAKAIREGIEEYLGSGAGARDPWDPADDAGPAATQLNSPTTSQQSHGQHTLSSSDRYDWFKVYLTGGNTYQFDSIGGNGDNYAELYDDPGGNNRLAYDDDAGGNLQFKLIYRPSSSGYRYLRVRAFSLGASCSYTLHYAQTGSGSPPPGPAPPYIFGEFNTQGYADGWGVYNAYAAVTNGIFFLDPGAGDFYISSPRISALASVYRYVELRMASNATNSRAKIYFRTSIEDYYSEDKTLVFTASNCYLCGNAPFYTYQLYGGGHGKWRGTLTGIRFDPAENGTAGTNRDSIGVDYVRLKATP